MAITQTPSKNAQNFEMLVAGKNQNAPRATIIKPKMIPYL